MYTEKTEATQCSNWLQTSLHRLWPEKLKKKTKKNSAGLGRMSSTTCKASENVYEKDELTSQKLSLLQWVVHKNCFSDLCNRTHSNDRALAWRKNENRSLRKFSSWRTCLLTLTGKKRRQCELPMTTDFDAPLRTQTIITDKVYFSFCFSTLGLSLTALAEAMAT